MWNVSTIYNQNTSTVAICLPNSTDGTPTELARPITLAVCLAIIFCLSTFGNSLVLYIIGRHLRFSSVTNAFIASLSISDLLLTCTCLPLTFIASVTGSWIFGDGLCIVYGTLCIWFSSCSVLMILLITVERALTITRMSRMPFRLPGAIIMIACGWVASLIPVLPWYLIGVKRRVFYKEDFYHCLYVFHLKSSPHGVIFSSIYISILFILPFIIIIYCCCRIWIAQKAHEKRIRPASTSANQLLFHGETRIATTVLIMGALCLVCRGIYIIIAIGLAIANRLFTPGVDTACFLFLVISCAVNPIIYAARNPNVAQYVTCGRFGKCRAKPPEDISASNSRTSQSEGSGLPAMCDASMKEGSPDRSSGLTTEGLNLMFTTSIPDVLFYAFRKDSTLSTNTETATV